MKITMNIISKEKYIEIKTQAYNDFNTFNQLSFLKQIKFLNKSKYIKNSNEFIIYYNTLTIPDKIYYKNYNNFRNGNLSAQAKVLSSTPSLIMAKKIEILNFIDLFTNLQFPIPNVTNFKRNTLDDEINKLLNKIKEYKNFKNESYDPEDPDYLLRIVFPGSMDFMDKKRKYNLLQDIKIEALKLYNGMIEINDLFEKNKNLKILLGVNFHDKIQQVEEIISSICPENLKKQNFVKKI